VGLCRRRRRLPPPGAERDPLALVETHRAPRRDGAALRPVDARPLPHLPRRRAGRRRRLRRLRYVFASGEALDAALVERFDACCTGRSGPGCTTCTALPKRRSTSPGNAAHRGRAAMSFPSDGPSPTRPFMCWTATACRRDWRGRRDSRGRTAGGEGLYQPAGADQGEVHPRSLPGGRTALPHRRPGALGGAMGRWSISVASTIR